LNLSTYIKEFKYNLKLAYPIIIGMVGHTLVAFIDNVMVGKLGTSQLAAISLGNSFIFLAMSFGIGFSTAITPLIAESNAKNNIKKIKTILSNGIIICFILGFILSLIVLLSKPLIYSLGQPDNVVQLAFPYITWVAISLFPLVLFQSFKQFSDGLALTKIAMISTIIANMINIILNYILIYGKLGFPKMELVGAGIGTLISRISMVIIIVVLIKSNKKISKYISGFFYLDYSSFNIKKIINLGYPSALQMMFEVGFFISGIWVCGIIGTNYQAANQIALNLSTITFMVALGLSIAATIRIGNQKGLNDFVNLRRIAISFFLMIILIEILFAIIFLLASNLLPWLYLEKISSYDIMETANIASKLLLIVALFQIFDGIQIVAQGSLRGIQDVKTPSLICFFSYVCFGIPIMTYLGLYTEFKALGVWIGFLVGLAVASILLSIRFFNKCNLEIKKK
jgi:MATE family multidrug resistance protein|tara:strand:+ start:6113 stop:7477 length:1365 start_codon:yes stop_codon:yes gene_type:complete